MKRLLTILLLFIMCFSFVACSPESTKTTSTPSPTPPIESLEPETPSDEKTLVEPEKPKRPENEILVVITPSGKKYHAGNCQYINDNPNIGFKYLDEAKREGYTACSKCEKIIENELLN